MTFPRTPLCQYPRLKRREIQNRPLQSARLSLRTLAITLANPPMLLLLPFKYLCQKVKSKKTKPGISEVIDLCRLDFHPPSPLPHVCAVSLKLRHSHCVFMPELSIAQLVGIYISLLYFGFWVLCFAFCVHFNQKESGNL